jgi:hypothetical protein
MAYVPHTLYGLTRRTAYDLWRGPTFIEKNISLVSNRHKIHMTFKPINHHWISLERN